MEHKLICESRVFIYLNPLSPHYGDQVPPGHFFVYMDKI